jgi:hypothetical protein
MTVLLCLLTLMLSVRFFIVILRVVLKGVVMLIVVAPFVQRVTDNVIFLSKK